MNIKFSFINIINENNTRRLETNVFRAYRG